MQSNLVGALIEPRGMSGGVDLGIDIFVPFSILMLKPRSSHKDHSKEVSMSAGTKTLSRVHIGHLAGFLFLLIIFTGVFAEAFVRGSIFVGKDVSEVASSIREQSLLFRIGIVADLVAFLSVVFLTWCLFVLTRPYGQSLSMLGAFLRLGEAVISVVITIFGFVILLLLTDPSLAEAFSTEQVSALALVFKKVHSVGYDFGIVFSTMGVTVFSLIFFFSRDIPRIISVVYIVAAIQLLSMTIAMMLFPELNSAFYPYYLIPMLIAESSIGLWLLFFSVKKTRN